MSLESRILLQIIAKLSAPGDLSEQKVDLLYRKEIALADGAGSEQANNIFHDRRVIAASDYEYLNLSEGVSNPFGAVLAFSAVKAMLIRSDPDNAAEIVVGGSSVSPFGEWRANAGASVKIRPGGVLVLVAPGDGYAVAASSSDVIKISNSDSGNPANYDVVVVGVASEIPSVSITPFSIVEFEISSNGNGVFADFAISDSYVYTMTGKYLYMAEVVPGATAPSNGFGVSVEDASGDMFGGGLLGLTQVREFRRPITNGKEDNIPYDGRALTIKTSGNIVSNATYKLRLFMAR